MQKIIVTGAALLVMGGCATVPQDVGMGSILYITTPSGNVLAQMRMADNLACEAVALQGRRQAKDGEHIGCTTWDRSDQLPIKVRFSNMQGMPGADAKLLSLDAINTEVCLGAIREMAPAIKKAGGKIDGNCL